MDIPDKTRQPYIGLIDVVVEGVDFEGCPEVGIYKLALAIAMPSVCVTRN
jgi:hypothetical protein